MTDDPSLELLRRLTLAAGPPGAEDEVRAVVRGALEGIGSISYDGLGSLVCEARGTADAPRIALVAHMDEVGFLVQSIADDGRVALAPLGSWWGHVLLAQRVEILSDRGKVPGVIGSKPPHFLSADERGRVVEVDQMYVDLGASTRAEAEATGVRVGDPVAPAGSFVEMAVAGTISAKALDDRAGVGVMCEVVRALADGRHPNTVVGVGSVQEEVGCRGAVTASALARPDLAIVLEATPADDLAGSREQQGRLGGGPQIRFSDPTALSNRRLVRFVESVARDAKIKVQLAVRRSGGTDAKSIHLHDRGVPTVVIGVPARYIHTHASMMRLCDYRATRDLVVEVVGRRVAAAVAGVTRFGPEAG